MAEMRQRTSKPLMAILLHSFSADDVEKTRDMIQKIQAGGVPAFTSIERGAYALRNALDYYSLMRMSSKSSP